VTALFHLFAANAAALTESRKDREKKDAEFNTQIFDAIDGMAREAGVACTCYSHSGEHIWQEVIMAAEKFGLRCNMHGIPRSQRHRGGADRQ